MQRKYCFYSSSLLIAYDAQHLRQHCPLKDDICTPFLVPKFDKEVISGSVPCIARGTHNLSGTNELTFSSRLKKSVSAPVSIPCEQILNQSRSRNSNMDRLCRSSPSQFTYSCTNDITKKDEENVSMENKCKWVKVKMIDFTHVFPGENNDLDRNYRDGIQMLIQLLSMIKKSDCMH